MLHIIFDLRNVNNGGFTLQSSMLPLLNCLLPSVFRFLKKASPPPPEDELPSDGIAFCLNLNSTFSLATAAAATTGAPERFRGAWKSIFSSSLFSLEIILELFYGVVHVDHVVVEYIMLA